MISISKAIDIISKIVIPTHKTKNLLLHEALNFVLAEDVISKINMPPFRQSAMDGYALHLHEGSSYSVIDEVKAGDNSNPTLLKGQATRIFTGAAVPDSANAIIIQEHVTIENEKLLCNKPVNLNANIRPLGEQIMEGEIALSKGTKLTEAGIGYLASLGIEKVVVYQKPKTAIIVTGNELVTPGNTLQHGQIYESNSIMLQSVLRKRGITDISLYKSADNFEETKATINSALENNDLVLISGGISVGDYDFVGKALNELNTESLFYKVKQKPGKPLFFGKNKNTFVFALPGNPASALSCFYNYVDRAIAQMSGEEDYELMTLNVASKNTFNKRGDRAQFLKARYCNHEVEILDGQNSSMLHTFAISNAMVFIPEDKQNIEVGDIVETILI